MSETLETWTARACAATRRGRNTRPRWLGWGKDSHYSDILFTYQALQKRGAEGFPHPPGALAGCVAAKNRRRGGHWTQDHTYHGDHRYGAI